MIWTAGRIVPDDALTISVLDRTFEHGLGLFETFRTWNGHATLLPRHLARMTNSARALGLALDPTTLPDADAVSRLLIANHHDGDAMLRITLSGGISEDIAGAVWMRSSPLPPPMIMTDPSDMPEIRGKGLHLFLRSEPLEWVTPLGRHKTLNYWERRLETGEDGRMEWVVRAKDDQIVEGTRTNVFYVIGDTLKTASLDYPILPGVMCELVLERAKDIGIDVEEVGHDVLRFIRDRGNPEFKSHECWHANEMFVTNSVRGIVPVATINMFASFDCPGAMTQRIWQDTQSWLNRGGIDP